MQEMLEVLSPLGKIRAHPALPAERPGQLAGLRPGVVENQKHNARLLMESMVDGMREHIPLGTLTVGSKTSATPPRPRLVDLMRDNDDFILVGTCD